jgi:hypothetical protein
MSAVGDASYCGANASNYTNGDPNNPTAETKDPTVNGDPNTSTTGTSPTADTSTNPTPPTKQTSANSAKGSHKHTACLSMVFLAISVATRVSDIRSQIKTRDNSCQSVHKLAPLQPQPVFAPATGVSTSIESLLPWSEAIAAPTPGGDWTQDVRRLFACVQSSGIDACAREQHFAGAAGTAGVDASMLSSFGLDRPLARTVGVDGMNQIMNMVERGMSPGDFVRSIVGSSPLPPSVLAAMGQLGDAVASKPASSGWLAQLPPLRSDATASASHPRQPQFPGADRVPANRELDYAPMPESTDIWHSAAASTIFQIVSHRISRDVTRVEQLEWTTPMNRKLNGLK